MGGLGNARRGGRSPPLLIGALIACVLVLGFNYWVSSSRNLELQTRLFEMEGSLRRAATERATMEEKKKEFEEELRIQNEQIPRIEGRYKIQLETVLANWKQEKTALSLNISSSTRIIQTLKAQLTNLEEIQKHWQDCQTNQINLSTALTECKVQVGDLQKECQAKPSLKAAPGSPTSQENSSPALGRSDQPEKPGLDETKRPPVFAHTGTDPGALAKAKLSALETNEIPKSAEEEAPPLLTVRELPKPQRTLAPLPMATRKSGVAMQDLAVGRAKQGVEVEVMETHTGKVAGDAEVLVEKDDKPVKEPEDKAGNQPGDKTQDSPGDQQNAGEPETVKQTQLKGKGPALGRTSLDLKDQVANYNGDEENEGEFEADKQEELAKH